MKNINKVSFARDVRPLFRSVDIEHMKGMDILLDDYKYMSDATNQYENAQRVYDSLTGKTEPRMPPNGPYWTKDKLDLFEKRGLPTLAPSAGPKLGSARIACTRFFKRVSIPTSVILNLSSSR